MKIIHYSRLKKYTILLVLLFIQQTNTTFSKWDPIDTPFGGTINNLVRNNNKIYASTLLGGAYISTNDGNSWVKITTGYSDLRQCTEVDAVNDVILLKTRYGGVYRSTNEGVSWDSVHSGVIDGNTPDVSVNRITHIGSDFYICATTELLKTTDNGINWIPRLSGVKKQGIYDIIEKDGIYFLATESGVFSSNNSGNNWKETSLKRILVYKLFKLAGKIFAAGYDPAGTGGITYSLFYSDDNGDTWLLYNNTDFQNGLIKDFSSDVNTASIMVIKKIDSTISNRIYQTLDNGAKWESIYNSETYYTNDINCLVQTPNAVVMGKNVTGIYKRTTGSTSWLKSTSSIYGNIFTSIIPFNKTLYVSTGDHGASEYDINTNIWTHLPLSPSRNKDQYKAINELFLMGNQILAGTDGGVYGLRDDPLKWADLGLNSFSILSVDNIGTKIYTLGNTIRTSISDPAIGHLFISNDTARNWNIKDIPDNPEAYSMISIGNNILLGTSNGIYRTANDGSSWDRIGPQFIQNKGVHCFAKINKNIIAGSYDGLYYTSDGGANWNESTNGLSSLSRLIISLFVIDEYVIAGTFDGVFISSDYGLSWRDVSEGLKDRMIKCISSDNRTLYISVFGDAIYRAELSSLFGMHISNVPSNVVCAGLQFNIDYKVNKNYKFNSANYFSVQLSDENGIFNQNPIVIGRTATPTDGTTDGSILVKIPENTPPGQKYQIRIVSSNPEIIGMNYGPKLTILRRSKPEITGDTVACAWNTYTYTVTPNPGYIYKWIAGNGSIQGADNNTSVNILWLNPGQAYLKIIQQNIADCSDSSFIDVNINSSPEKPVISQDDTTLVSSSDKGNQWYLDGLILKGETGKTIKPTSKGNYTVMVSNNTGCNSPLSEPYYFDLDNEFIRLDVDDAEGSPSDLVNLIIRFKKNKEFSASGITGFTAKLVTDASVLYPIGNDKGEIIAGKRYLSINIDTTYISSNIVKSVSYRAMLGSSMKSQIYLQDIKTNNVFNKILSRTGTFKLNGVCVEGGPRLITSSGSVQISSILPNPAKDDIDISYETIEKGISRLLLVNESGTVVRTFIEKEIPTGIHCDSYNLYGLPNGTYYIVLETPVNKTSTGFVISR